MLGVFAVVSLQPSHQLTQVAQFQLGRFGMRPGPPAAVEPGAAQAGRARGRDVEVGVVADVQHLRGREAESRAGVVEDLGRGLGNAAVARRQAVREVVVQADPHEVGVAVGDADQRPGCREGRALYRLPATRVRR